MPLGDSLTACFVDRCDGGESLCSAVQLLGYLRSTLKMDVGHL